MLILYKTFKIKVGCLVSQDAPSLTTTFLESAAKYKKKQCDTNPSTFITLHLSSPLQNAYTAQIQTHTSRLPQTKMMHSGVPTCITCCEQVGLDHNGEVFVACHECSYPICKSCFEYDLKDGRSSCSRCGAPYDGILTFYSLFLLEYCNCLVWHFNCQNTV